MLTQFILVQPVTHKGNSLKVWFTKYMTHGANQTKLRTFIVPWSQMEPWDRQSHTIHTIQCTRTTIKSSNMRSPATSRPLNGYFAITLSPFNTLAISSGIISKSLTFNINIVHIIYHPGGFLGPPPGHTAWRWSARAHQPLQRKLSSWVSFLLAYFSCWQTYRLGQTLLQQLD